MWWWIWYLAILFVNLVSSQILPKRNILLSIEVTYNMFADDWFCKVSNLPPPRLKRAAVSTSDTPTSFIFFGSEYERFFWSVARRLRPQIRIRADIPSGGTLGRAGGLGLWVSGLTTCRSFGMWGKLTVDGDCGMIKMPCGLGLVFGPFFSREWILTGTDGGCWLLRDEAKGAATEGGGLTEELRSLLMKEVDRRTLGWASFKEFLYDLIRERFTISGWITETQGTL